MMFCVAGILRVARFGRIPPTVCRGKHIEAPLQEGVPRSGEDIERHAGVFDAGAVLGGCLDGRYTW